MAYYQVTMFLNTTLQDLSFEPFFNVSKYYLLSWSIVNFLKCWYVTISIVDKRIPPWAVAAIFTGVTVVYIIHARAFTWLLNFQLLNLLCLVYIVLTTRHYLGLLFLLSITIYLLKPFDFILDVFAILFFGIDIPAVFLENTLYWSLLYFNCLAVSVVMADMNSRGPDPYKFLPNCFYVCFFWLICWSATDRMRLIPVFIAIVIYVLDQFNRDEPIRYSSPGFDELPPIVLDLDSL
ncbi:hypothetical protein AVEN_40361-1 [Araneus ventricosus]|uniref:Uncharacterized protein n=1 Tax=Araneus ventricosus TaxID=182803 RepID=A0A4Y2M4K5_ARAVE|nr:hypothetical protein AVEN_40361-1 [Araneus ventricosus]